MAEQEYFSDRYRQLNSQMAKRERSAKRKSSESLAARGALHSGMTNTSEREIEGATNELWHEGARDIENLRYGSEQKEIDRQHALTLQGNQFGENAAQRGWQTGEREGTQLFATGEREETQQWQGGQNEAQRQMTVQIQQMSDDARYQLQELVNSGKMTLQEAEQQWTSYENGLNRQLEQWTTSGQWGHETGMQGNTIAQEQWSAIFGQEAALTLQDDTQSFEEFMAQLGRDWELTDRPWQDEQALMDRQTELYAAGLDWLNDNYANTGYPAWMVGREGGTEYTDTSMYNPGSPNYEGGGVPAGPDPVDGQPGHIAAHIGNPQYGYWADGVWRWWE